MWTVVCVKRSIYEGRDPAAPEWPREVARTTHRTYLGADFWRRFRFSYPTIGQRWVETRIEMRDQLGRFRRRPRYADLLDRRVWPVLYWLRTRWDGIRYGLDRDRRS